MSIFFYVVNTNFINITSRWFAIYMHGNFSTSYANITTPEIIENCKFIGSESSKDYIKMSGHESPDSAFCGGIVGLIRTAKYDVPASVVNCEVIDTEVIGNATCIITTYGDPDIYVGGIVGSGGVSNSGIDDTSTIQLRAPRLVLLFLHNNTLCKLIITSRQ